MSKQRHRPAIIGFKGEDTDPEPFTKKDQIVRMGSEPIRLALFTSILGVEFADCPPDKTMVSINENKLSFMGLEDLKK